MKLIKECDLFEREKEVKEYKSKRLKKKWE